MSNNINTNILKHFILKFNSGRELNENNARRLGLDVKEFIEGDVDENGLLDIDEILDNVDLTEFYQAAYTEEAEKKAVAKDEDQEKEEQLRVKDKNNAGV